jgi:hypothetical protein
LETCDVPSNRPTVSCKWLFKCKYNSNGTIAHLKARLVARRSIQYQDIDFFETFSLVVKMTSLRALIFLVATHNFYIHQMDVTIIFLHDNFLKKIYLDQP